MKKAIIPLLILLFGILFCSQNSGEQAHDPQASQKIGDEENLIISDVDLDFSTHRVTFIELGADRCIPCKAMQPVMREIAQKYKDAIQVVFYDVWKNPQFAEDYGVKMIPTQVFFDKNGDEIFRHVGFFSKEDILKMLKDKGLLETKW